MWTIRTTDADIRFNSYYFSNWNPFYAVVVDGVHILEMPNCTTYSFGRFAEGAGVQTVPTLSRSNAEDWYSFNDGYERGQTPRVGAVCCFRDGNFSGDGHVCIVEAVNGDGSILVTESGYGGYFWRQNTRHPGGAYPYSDTTEGYIFQGFIYNPYVMPATWHAKATGSYSKTEIEGQENGLMIAAALMSAGWSIPAIAAFLGNGAGESGLNPWRWESDYVPTVSEFNSWTPQQAQSHGYGLVQFTPASTYINAANAAAYAADGYDPNFLDSAGTPDDGGGQMAFLADHIPNDWLGGNYSYYYQSFQDVGVNIDSFYNMSFAEFIAGNDTIANLTGAFELRYERPDNYYAAQSYHHRVSEAQWWLDFLNGQPFPTKRKILWLLMKAAKERRARS